MIIKRSSKTKLKIRLSKSEWLEIGKTAGWFKRSQLEMEAPEIMDYEQEDDRFDIPAENKVTKEDIVGKLNDLLNIEDEGEYDLGRQELSELVNNFINKNQNEDLILQDFLEEEVILDNIDMIKESLKESGYNVSVDILEDIEEDNSDLQINDENNDEIVKDELEDEYLNSNDVEGLEEEEEGWSNYPGGEEKEDELISGRDDSSQWNWDLKREDYLDLKRKEYDNSKRGKRGTRNSDPLEDGYDFLDDGDDQELNFEEVSDRDIEDIDDEYLRSVDDPEENPVEDLEFSGFEDDESFDEENEELEEGGNLSSFRNNPEEYPSDRVRKHLEDNIYDKDSKPLDFFGSTTQKLLNKLATKAKPKVKPKGKPKPKTKISVANNVKFF